jgi:hypothetical protein
MGLLLATVALVASLFQPQDAAPTRRLAAAQAQPQTLYASPTGTIAAFAQDGPLLAWFAPSAKHCNSVRLLSLSIGGGVVLPDESPGALNVTCQWDVVPPVRLALAGTSAIWTLHDKLSPLPFDYLLGAGSHDRRERRFKEITHGARGAGLWFGGIAGDSTADGTSLVVGVTAIAYTDELACLSKGSCALDVASTGGGVYRIVGRSEPILVPGTKSAIAVAVSGTSVASIPAGSVGPDGRPEPSAGLPVEIRDVGSGTVLATIVPGATPIALALTPGVLALLEQVKSGRHLAWYDTATGALRGDVPVPADTSPELTANDQEIVFRVGRSIRAASVATRAIRTLTKAASTPIGLSLDGTRLAWAENVDGRGRIRALVLSGKG